MLLQPVEKRSLVVVKYFQHRLIVVSGQTPELGGGAAVCLAHLDRAQARSPNDSTHQSLMAMSSSTSASNP